MSQNVTADRAVDLRTRRVDGIVQPGDTVSSENTLIGEFGASWAVVHSALPRRQGLLAEAGLKPNGRGVASR